MSARTVARSFEGAQRVFITGVGRATPGVDQLKGKGMLLDVQYMMDRLIKTGIHNPVDKRPVSPDFAKKNFGINKLSVSNISEFAKGYLKREDLSTAEDICEYDMAALASQQALENAGLQLSDLDMIVHVSPSIHLVGVPEKGLRGMQNFFKYYPPLLTGFRSDCVLQHHEAGCSGIVTPFKLVNSFIKSGEYKHIMVITSVFAPRDEIELFASKNDIELWANYLLSGDGATAFVLSGGNDEKEVLKQTREKKCYEIEKTSSYTDTSVVVAEVVTESIKEGDDLILKRHAKLNLQVERGSFIPQMKDWLKSEDITQQDIDTLVIHQSDSLLVSEIQKEFGDKVLNIASKYGNLAPSSLGTQFYEQIVQGENKKTKNGDKIVGFAMGADTGLTYGGFVARAHVAE